MWHSSRARGAGGGGGALGARRRARQEVQAEARVRERGEAVVELHEDDEQAVDEPGGAAVQFVELRDVPEAHAEVGEAEQHERGEEDADNGGALQSGPRGAAARAQRVGARGAQRGGHRDGVRHVVRAVHGGAERAEHVGVELAVEVVGVLVAPVGLEIRCHGVARHGYGALQRRDGVQAAVLVCEGCTARAARRGRAPRACASLAVRNMAFGGVQHHNADDYRLAVRQFAITTLVRATRRAVAHARARRIEQGGERSDPAAPRRGGASAAPGTAQSCKAPESTFCEGAQLICSCESWWTAMTISRSAPSL